MDFQALAKQSPESTFFAVLDALKQIPSTAQRSSAAVQLFGRSGRAMLKLIGLGSAGIGAEAINTRRMGIASRPSDMASMGRASDTLDDLKNNLKGFGDQLAIRLAPQIEHVGKEFLGFSTKTNLAANAAEFFATSLQTSALYIAQILDQFSIVGIDRGICNNNYSNPSTRQPEADTSSRCVQRKHGVVDSARAAQADKRGAYGQNDE